MRQGYSVRNVAGANSAAASNASSSFATRFALCRTKDSRPEKYLPIHFGIANGLGSKLREAGHYSEAYTFCHTAPEGRRRLHGDLHMDTIASINNMGFHLGNLNLHDRALEHYYEAKSLQEKLLGKLYPYTLATTSNIASAFKDLEDFTMSEVMYRLVLDRYVLARGKEHNVTKFCAKHLNMLLESMGKMGEKAILELDYPESGLRTT